MRGDELRKEFIQITKPKHTELESFFYTTSQISPLPSMENQL
jgi:hypothetical protein